MIKKEFKVFSITNKADNNKCFIGITTQDVRERIKKMKNSGRNNKIVLALNAFDDSCFDIDIPHHVYMGEEAANMANILIKKYDTITNGYNMSTFTYSNTKTKSTTEVLTCRVPKGTTKLIDTLANMCGTSRNSIICSWIEEKLKLHNDIL